MIVLVFTETKRQTYIEASDGQIERYHKKNKYNTLVCYYYNQLLSPKKYCNKIENNEVNSC